MLDIFFDLVLLASAILENGLSVRFVDKLVFEGERVLSRRQKGWIWAAVGMASLLEFANKTMGIYFSIGMLGIQLLLIEGSILVVRRGKFISTTCVLIIFFSIVQTIELLIVIVVSTNVFNNSNMLALYENDSACLRNSILLATRFAMWGIYHIMKMREVRINHPMLLGVASILSYLDMFYLYMYAYFDDKVIEIGTFTLALAILCLIVVGLLVGSLYYLQKEKNVEIEQRDIALANNYTRFYNLYGEIKYISHDMKNHLNILEDYMRHKEYQKAYDYMIKLREPVLQIEQYAYSGNRVIDTVLNDKFALAQREDIKINQEIDNIGQIEVSDKDLCIILSNLLDNAIEACLRFENQEKWIDITLRKLTYGLIFKISNPKHEKYITIEKGKYLTTKDDKNIHGIGLESVNYILKKYDSRIKIENKNDIFAVSVVFFL